LKNILNGLKLEEKERKMWEIEGGSHGEVTEYLFRGVGGIPGFSRSSFF
jgi:hypothetical protein